MLVYRLVHKDFIHVALSGDGAKRLGGRWNSVGVPVVYCAQSASLAVLECLVNLGHVRFMSNYYMMSVSFDGRMMKKIKEDSLPDGWNMPVTGDQSKAIGDDWVLSGSSLACRVPSVVVSGEYNYLLNPLHKEFAKVKVSKPQPLMLDSRLTSI